LQLKIGGGVVHDLKCAFSTAVQFQDAVSINMDTVVNGVSLRMPIVIYFGRLVAPCQISCLVSDVFISGKRMHVVSDMIVIISRVNDIRGGTSRRKGPPKTGMSKKEGVECNYLRFKSD
jgi:hypothetical protein